MCPQRLLKVYRHAIFHWSMGLKGIRKDVGAINVRKQMRKDAGNQIGNFTKEGEIMNYAQTAEHRARIIYVQRAVRCRLHVREKVEIRDVLVMD
jgi:hypothetical protein